MNRLTFFALLLALTLLSPLSVLAENSTTAGGYTVHYNAFTTSTLTPEVAKAYDIQRSKYRGMLNVSIIREKEGTTGTSVPASVDVKTMLLTGQNMPLTMREIKDQDAVYYIGEFPVQNEQKVNFVIEVTPEGTDDVFIVNMTQQFFTD